MIRTLTAATVALGFATAGHSAVITGAVTGAWVDPVGTFGFSIDIDDAAGSATVAWGEAVTEVGDNRWSFDGLGSDGNGGWMAAIGSPFEIGELSYRNGRVRGHDFGGATLAIRFDLLTPDFATETFRLGLEAINTPNNTGDPYLDRDFAEISSTGPVTFRLADVRYQISVLGFADQPGEPISMMFDAPENATRTAKLYAQIDVAPVPVPAALPMMLSLFGGLALLGLRRRPGRRTVYAETEAHSGEERHDTALSSDASLRGEARP